MMVWFLLTWARHPELQVGVAFRKHHTEQSEVEDEFQLSWQSKDEVVKVSTQAYSNEKFCIGHRPKIVISSPGRTPAKVARHCPILILWLQPTSPPSMNFLGQKSTGVAYFSSSQDLPTWGSNLCSPAQADAFTFELPGNPRMPNYVLVCTHFTLVKVMLCTLSQASKTTWTVNFQMSAGFVVAEKPEINC